MTPLLQPGVSAGAVCVCSTISLLGCCIKSCAQAGRRGPGGQGCGTVTDDVFPVCLECGQDVELTQRM